MKKIVYILIGFLISSLVYITFLADIPETVVPVAAVPQQEENNENPEYDVSLLNPTDIGWYGYRKYDIDLNEKGILVGKSNPMLIKETLKSNIDINTDLDIPVDFPDDYIDDYIDDMENIGNTGSSSIIVPPVEQPGNNNGGITTTPSLSINEIKKLIEDSIKEAIANIQKDGSSDVENKTNLITEKQIKKALEDYRSSQTTVEKKEYGVNIGYICAKCNEFFVFPLKDSQLTTPKLYGTTDTEIIQDGLSVAIKEKESQNVYSKGDGTVKKIENENDKDMCITVTVQQGKETIKYEHIGILNTAIEEGKKIKKGDLIGSIEVKGQAKGYVFNITTKDSKVESVVFLVPSEE